MTSEQKQSNGSVVNQTMKKMLFQAGLSPSPSKVGLFTHLERSDARFVLGVSEFEALMEELIAIVPGDLSQAREEVADVVYWAKTEKQSVKTGVYSGIRLEVSDEAPGIRLFYGLDKKRMLFQNPLAHRDEPEFKKINDSLKGLIETASKTGTFSAATSHIVLGIPEYEAMMDELYSFGMLANPGTALVEGRKIVDLAEASPKKVCAGIYFGVLLEVLSGVSGVHLYFGDGSLLSEYPRGKRSPKPRGVPAEAPKGQSELVLDLVGALRDVLNRIEEVLRG